jgi:hypothetical protein
MFVEAVGGVGTLQWAAARGTRKFVAVAGSIVGFHSKGNGSLAQEVKRKHGGSWYDYF